MKLFVKISPFFKNVSSINSGKIIIVQKSCTHCVDRGNVCF